MYFPSYAVGQILKAEVKSACYILTGSEQDYHVNLAEGDEVFVIKHDGLSTRDVFRGMDNDLRTISLEKSGDVDIHSLVFIGMVN